VECEATSEAQTGLTSHFTLTSYWILISFLRRCLHERWPVRNGRRTLEQGLGAREGAGARNTTAAAGRALTHDAAVRGRRGATPDRGAGEPPRASFLSFLARGRVRACLALTRGGPGAAAAPRLPAGAGAAARAVHRVCAMVRARPRDQAVTWPVVPCGCVCVRRRVWSAAGEQPGAYADESCAYALPPKLARHCRESLEENVGEVCRMGRPPRFFARRCSARTARAARLMYTLHPFPALPMPPRSPSAALRGVHVRVRTHACLPAHSKFVAPVSKFLSFGTQLQTGTNPGEISQAGLRRKEVLRRKDGLPAEVHTANIGKEGVENPLGQQGSHTSFISGESFLHDSRHGEQFPFPGQEAGVQPGRMSKEGSAAGGSTAPWEAKQLERWKQHELSREQIRAAAEGSMPVLSKAAQRSSGLRGMGMGSRTAPQGSGPGEGGSLRSTLRGSLPGSPDSRKSISWEDEGTSVISPYLNNTEWDQARRARDAVPLNRKSPEEGEASGASVPVSVLHRDVRPGSASRNEATGQKMPEEEKFRIKSLGRVAELRQQEQDFEVQGPR